MAKNIILLKMFFNFFPIFFFKHKNLQDKMNFGEGKWTGLLYRSEFKVFTSLESTLVYKMESLSDMLKKLAKIKEESTFKMVLKPD